MRVPRRMLISMTAKLDRKQLDKVRMFGIRATVYRKIPFALIPTKATMGITTVMTSLSDCDQSKSLILSSVMFKVFL